MGGLLRQAERTTDGALVGLGPGWRMERKSSWNPNDLAYSRARMPRCRLLVRMPILNGARSCSLRPKPQKQFGRDREAQFQAQPALTAPAGPGWCPLV